MINKKCNKACKIAKIEALVEIIDRLKLANWYSCNRALVPYARHFIPIETITLYASSDVIRTQEIEALSNLPSVTF